MSQKKYHKELLKIVLYLAWAQWNRLGLLGASGTNLFSTDIEASILLFADVVRYDGRLYDGVWYWFKRYGDVVNQERLKTLIQKEKDEWVARFLGAFLEKQSPSQWKTVIKQCQRMCTPTWKEIPLSTTMSQKGWGDKDTLFLKWGILFHDVLPREKLQDHDWIFRTNAQLRYRYLCGVLLRADVLYLLSVSHKIKHKKEKDYHTSVRLAYLLDCNLSTVHRIKNDFEKGGFLSPSRDSVHNPHIMTWSFQNHVFLPSDKYFEHGIVYWSDINRLLLAALNLNTELMEIQDEAICKSHIVTFQDKFFPILDNHHEIPVFSPYGTALKPLEDYSVEQLIALVVERLQLFSYIICQALMLRCARCKTIFPSPMQGMISSLKKS